MKVEICSVIHRTADWKENSGLDGGDSENSEQLYDSIKT